MTTEAGLWYVANGIPVYPLEFIWNASKNKYTKKAHVTGWNKAAAARTPERVRSYFTDRFPDAGIGGVCSGRNLCIIDVDPRNGGDRTFQRLVVDLGRSWFDGCPKVVTPSGGLHLWFSAPPVKIQKSSNKLGAGIDVIVNDNGIVLPPSENGMGTYYWEGGEFPDLTRLPVLPDAITDRILSVHRKERIEKKVGQHRLYTRTAQSGRIAEGNRNDFLYKALGDLADRGASRETLEQTAEAICANEFEGTYDRGEAMDIITWALRRASGEVVDPIEWLAAWRPRIHDFDQLRLATALATGARKIIGPFTPAQKVVLDMSGFKKDKFYKVRDGLERLGSMRFTERGSRLATVYEFVMPSNGEEKAPLI